jgi:hypothetical protein
LNSSPTVLSTEKVDRAGGLRLARCDEDGRQEIAEQTIDIAAVPGVSIGAASVASNAVGATTRRVVLISDTDCWVSIGANPTAAKQTAGSFTLAAKSPSYPIKVVPGVTKIAVIQDSAAGYLSIIESL